MVEVVALLALALGAAVGAAADDAMLPWIGEEEARVELGRARANGHCGNETLDELLRDDAAGHAEQVLRAHGLTPREGLGLRNSTLRHLRLCHFKRARERAAELGRREGTRATFAANVRSFLTKAERKRANGFVPPSARSAASGPQRVRRRLEAAATSTDSVDWVGTAVSAEVQNQGSCGGCWAFSASECISAMNWIDNERTGAPFTLSAQQLISCDSSGGNSGCRGGSFIAAWSDYTASTALVGEAAYPFRDAGGETSPCDASAASDGLVRAKTNVLLRDMGTFASNELLAQTLEEHPVSIAIAASGDCFEYYSGGVLTVADCAAEMAGDTCELDHAVLLVGFSNSGSTFKIKNSWGSAWGEGGFVQFDNDFDLGAYACSGLLGMNMLAAFPQIAVETASGEAAAQHRAPSAAATSSRPPSAVLLAASAAALAASCV